MFIFFVVGNFVGFGIVVIVRFPVLLVTVIDRCPILLAQTIEAAAASFQ
jgi:hypothetical protein